MSGPAAKKGKRKAAETSEEERAAAKRLVSYGEAFMRMFDDYDESAPQPQQPFSSEGDDASSSGAGGSDSEDGGSEDDAAADAANGQKAQPAVEETIFDDRRWRSKGGASTSKPAAAAFAASGRTGGKPLRPGAPSGASVASASPSAAALKFALLRKAQKKKFMSAKAADIFEDVDVSTLAPALAAKGGANRDADEGGVTPEEWRKMQQEVELLGASALDKKQRKKWQAALLARMGAKAEKGQRMSAQIGKGLSKKRGVREERALQEAIEAGMVSKKGRGKAKRAAAEAGRDKGLMELGGSYRNGMLRVKGLNKKKAP